MAADPIVTLAQQRIISLSAELEADLRFLKGGNIAIEILRRLRLSAADAMAKLAFINLHTPEGQTSAKALQNDVQCYDEFFKHTRDLLQEGHQLDAEMKDDERALLLEVLLETPDGRREAVELGLVDDEQRRAPFE